MVYDSLVAGGKGASIGRNVFQSDDPAALVSKMSKIVHGGMTVEEAMQD